MCCDKIKYSIIQHSILHHEVYDNSLCGLEPETFLLTWEKGKGWVGKACSWGP